MFKRYLVHDKLLVRFGALLGVVMAWAALFVQRKNGGLTLILLSILMLLVGGGFIPPLFGIIAGVIGWYGKSKPELLS